MAHALAKLTATEFLEWEKAQEDKHEFIRGEVFAMAGGTLEHNATTGALYALLRTSLSGSPCRVFMSDVRLRVDSADAYFYPDVVVTCSPRDTSDLKSSTIHTATLIAEVLSPATEAFDRGLKFSHYRKLADLKEYVLIDPDAKTVEVFRRTLGDVWELHPPTAQFALASVDLRANASELFAP